MATQVKLKGFVEEVYEPEEIATSKGSFTKQFIKFIPDGEDYPLFIECSGDKLEETTLEEFAEQDVSVDFAIYSKMTDEGRVFNSLVLYNISSARKAKKEELAKKTVKKKR